MKLLPSDKVFCNSPWYELHIYWDGALSFCCHATPEVPYPVAKKSQYNIRTMSIAEWYASEPMQQARLRMLGSERWDHCRKCYHEEEHSDTSRRHRSNQKSVIFREQFQESFEQSPGYNKFADLNYQGLPVDLHIDLGNYCNLACKMCTPEASSRIASQHRLWKITDTVATDWTQDQATWDRFLAELAALPKLKNIHFMGGETLIQPRFEECIDYLIQHNRQDVSISFVTNGTVYNQALIKKLKQFARVGLEVSIETLGKTNDYIRQGTDTQLVVDNIMRYIAECNNTSITLTLRPAPSLLSARDYWQVIEFALHNQLLIKSNLCQEPKFLSIGTLPQSIRLTYLDNYKKLLQDLDTINLAGEYNESDPGNYRAVAKKQILQMISLLEQPDSERQHVLLTQLMQHIHAWDTVYGFDAREIYPELEELLTRRGYAV